MFWPLKNNTGAQKLESQFIKAVQPFSWLEVEDNNDPDTTNNSTRALRYVNAQGKREDVSDDI